MVRGTQRGDVGRRSGGADGPTAGGSGIEFPWSWLVFCVVTLVAWAGIAAAKTE
jgi:hypothetical protein